MSPENLKLVIGLGNPGKEYHDTYHNVGHLFVDSLEKISDLKFPADAKALAGKQVLKSNVFMNNSGLFVKKELKSRKLKPENLLIVHDDSDIEFGKVKLSVGRGSAGHKGVQNIIDQIKTKNFWRLRIGIRPIEKTRNKAGDFVLKKISPTNKKTLQNIFKTYYLL